MPVPKILAMFEMPQPTVHTAAGMKKIRKILLASRVTYTSPYPAPKFSWGLTMQSTANAPEANALQPKPNHSSRHRHGSDQRSMGSLDDADSAWDGQHSARVTASNTSSPHVARGNIQRRYSCSCSAWGVRGQAQVGKPVFLSVGVWLGWVGDMPTVVAVAVAK